MDTNPTLKKCPFCAEQVQAEAIKCKHCNEMLNSYSASDDRTNMRHYAATEDKMSLTERAGYKLGRVLKPSGMVIAAALVIGAVVYNHQQNHPSGGSLLVASERSEKTPEQLRADLRQRERNSPQDYLEVHSTMRTNHIGEKVIGGIVTNKASVAVYKDIVLSVIFLSKTEADLGTRELKIYETVPPGHSKTFKFKIMAPKETKEFTASVTDAASAD